MAMEKSASSAADQDGRVSTIEEMQKSLGEIRSEINGLRTTTESIKTKVDDLVKWKHMIVGGAVTIGFLAGLAVTASKLL